jgi:Icc-related predicted phosphoesterase
MRLVALPDLHGDIRRLDDLADHLSAADVILLVGDLTNAGGDSGAAKVVDAIRHYNPFILAIPGNWDDSGVSTYLTREKINLHRRHVIINQLAFAGVGGAWLCHRLPPHPTKSPRPNYKAI